MIAPLSFKTHFVIIVHMIQYQSELDTSSKHCIKFSILEKNLKAESQGSEEISKLRENVGNNNFVISMCLNSSVFRLILFRFIVYEYVL